MEVTSIPVVLLSSQSRSLGHLGTLRTPPPFTRTVSLPLTLPRTNLIFDYYNQVVDVLLLPLTSLESRRVSFVHYGGRRFSHGGSREPCSRSGSTGPLRCPVFGTAPIPLPPTSFQKDPGRRVRVCSLFLYRVTRSKHSVIRPSLGRDPI